MSIGLSCGGRRSDAAWCTSSSSRGGTTWRHIVAHRLRDYHRWRAFGRAGACARNQRVHSTQQDATCTNGRRKRWCTTRRMVIDRPARTTPSQRSSADSTDPTLVSCCDANGITQLSVCRALSTQQTVAGCWLAHKWCLGLTDGTHAYRDMRAAAKGWRVPRVRPIPVLHSPLPTGSLPTSIWRIR